MTIHIGTSGWQYRHWLGRFYPSKPRVPDDLAFYAGRFATVELDSTFYRLPASATFEAWKRRTPDEFVFSMKASRYLTHIRRLRDPHDPVDLILSRAAGLGEKLGPVLLQLPPQMRRDDARLAATLREFDGRARVAVEFRHDSWFDDAVRRILEAHDAAICLADSGSRLVTPVWRTAGWGYVRFHFGTGSPPSCYGAQALVSRAHLLAVVFGDADVFVYFNNDAYGCALRDASRFARACARIGLTTTRTPEPEIRAG